MTSSRAKATRSIENVLPEEGGFSGEIISPFRPTPPIKKPRALHQFSTASEISAQIVNETYYWLPNDAALPLVNPEIRNNPAFSPRQMC
jgi:hypothetical protein